MKAQISLTDFVDFVIKSGMPRLTKVREIMDREDYHPAFDFWKPLRDGIETCHRNGLDLSFLDLIVQKQTDPRKKSKYPEVINSYKKFIGRKETIWFEPPKTKCVLGDLSITINPELGLYINEKPHIIKLFFKEDKLDKRKSEVVFHLMEDQLRDLDDVPVGAIMSVLDVKTGKLLFPTKPPENISILLKAEANTFMQIWNQL